MDVLVDLLHEAIDAAGLISPVIVGHSLAAIAATIYATKFRTSGVVNVDQSLRTEQFSGFLRSMDEQLRGPAFPTIWGGFLASMTSNACHRTRRSCSGRPPLLTRISCWVTGQMCSLGLQRR